jgi:hypothetical protein
MKKTVLATAAIALTLVTFNSAMAANSTAGSDNKIKSGAQSVGRAIMWGPKKIGAGLSKLGTGIKNKFHHS